MERSAHRLMLMIPGAALILAAGAWAQTPTTTDRPASPPAARPVTPPGQPKGTDTHKGVHPLMKATDVLEIDVTNAKGEDLGEIEDIVIDLERGRIGYAVLAFGGVMDIGDKLFAVPWSALTPAPGTEKMYVALDKTQLEAMEGFDKDHYPDMTDPAWGEATYRRFNTEPYWMTERARPD